MTGSAPSLFRREALEDKTDPSPAGALRVVQPWTSWMYVLLLGFLAAGIAAASAVRVDDGIAGPAQVDLRSGTFVAVIPGSGTGPVPPSGRSVRLTLDGTRAAVIGRALRLEPLPAEARLPARLPPPDGPALLVTGVLEPSNAAHADVKRPGGEPASVDQARSEYPGRALVTTGSQRVLTVLTKGLWELAGKGDSG